MSRLDLTHFGFTPTESLVYEVLVTGGPGTGYAIARSAGLARANAYSALEGLVSKGAARVDVGRPKRYRPESPAALIARISTDYGLALERLSSELDGVSVPPSPTLVEIESGRGVLQLVTHDVARATASVALLAPGDAYPILAPALRRPYLRRSPAGALLDHARGSGLRRGRSSGRDAGVARRANHLRRGWAERAPRGPPGE